MEYERKGLSLAYSLGIAMQRQFNLCSAVVAACLLFATSLSIGQDSVAPSTSETAAFDVDELARKAEAIMALMLKHHIDPPTPAEMWLAGTRHIQTIVAGRRPFPASPLELPALDTAALRREFLVQSLPREKLASRQAANPDEVPDLLRTFVGGMLPQGANLKSTLEIKRDESFRANRYMGTGITLHFDKASGYAAIGPMPGGPMERAGGRQGDRIVRIEDHDAHRMPLARVIELLSGDEGTTVRLELRAESATASRTVVVTRGHIQLPSIAGAEGADAKSGYHQFKLDSRIRYVKVTQIKGSTVHELRQLERRFRSDGGRALVVDFRSTHDTDLHHALLLADALLDGGIIGRLRTKERVQEFRADRERLFRGMPLALLVDQTTSGSGEWIAAALQDSHAAIIIGEPTAGYSFVPSFIPVPGENEFLELPTGVFERPNGRPFQRLINPDGSASGGIVPDRITQSAAQEEENLGVFQLLRRAGRNRVAPLRTASILEVAVSELESRLASAMD